MFQLKDCIAFLTTRAAKEMASKLEKRFFKYNISRAEFFVLYYISTTPNITQTILANSLNVTTPTVVKIIDRMEKRGLLSRIQDKQNRRINFLNLTPEGKKILATLLPVAETFKDDAIKGISNEDLDIYLKVLQKLQTNLDINIK